MLALCQALLAFPVPLQPAALQLRMFWGGETPPLHLWKLCLASDSADYSAVECILWWVGCLLSFARFVGRERRGPRAPSLAV